MKLTLDRGCRQLLSLATITLALCIFSSTAMAARTITDSAGRTVDIPDTIRRVFAAGPPASVLRPETLTG